MTDEELLAYALSKPGAWPDQPWEGDVVAKVGDKIFAFLGSGGTVGVKCGRGRPDAEPEPEPGAGASVAVPCTGTVAVVPLARALSTACSGPAAVGRQCSVNGTLVPGEISSGPSPPSRLRSFGGSTTRAPAGRRA